MLQNLQQSQQPQSGSQQPTGTPTGPPPFNPLTFGTQTLNLPMQPSAPLPPGPGQQIGMGLGKTAGFTSQTQISPVPPSVSWSHSFDLKLTD